MAPRRFRGATLGLIAVIVALLVMVTPGERPIRSVQAAPHQARSEKIAVSPPSPPPAESNFEALDRKLDSLTSALIARIDEAEKSEAKRQEQRLATALAEVPLKEATRQARGAEMALQEYKEKTYPSEREAIDQEIKYHQGEQIRVKERLNWAESMHKNKLLSEAQLGLDQSALVRADLVLNQARSRLETLESTTKPRRLAELEGEIERSADELRLKTLQWEREREREAALDLEVHAQALNAAEARGLGYVIEASALRSQVRRAAAAAEKARLIDQMATSLKHAEAAWSDAITIRAESRRSEIESRLRRVALESPRRTSPPPVPRPEPGPSQE